MKIAAVCPTYKRPNLLGRAIHCFLQQTHKDRELVILDDAGQYKSQEGDKWKIISTSERYSCLADKRQAVIEAVSSDVEGFVCWDDDDVYFPEAIASVSRALEQKPWAQCRIILETVAPRTLQPTKATGTKRTLKVGNKRVFAWGYGGCWAYNLEEFHKLNGYKDLPPSASEDIDLARRFFLEFGESADSSKDHMWYWYNRDPGVSKVSTDGADFWAIRKKWEYDKVDYPPIGWNGPNLYDYEILTETRPRIY